MIQLSPPELVKLNECVEEYINSLTRVSAEKDFQKDVTDRAKEEFKLTPAEFKSLVAERYNDKCSEDIAKKQEIVDLNETILNAVRNSKRTTVAASPSV